MILSDVVKTSRVNRFSKNAKIANHFFFVLAGIDKIFFLHPTRVISRYSPDGPPTMDHFLEYRQAHIESLWGTLEIEQLR